MKAAIIRRLDGRFDIGDVEFDEPRGHEVRVRVEAAGLCHSDMNVATIDRGRPLPLIAGHELAGVVEAVGPEVTSLTPGDHVVGTEVRFCGVCVPCASGAPFRCLDPGSLERPAGAPARATLDGVPIHTLGVAAFAERSIAHEHQFVRIPDAVPFEVAALLGCAVSTGLGAVLNSADVRPGQTVAVIGLGGVGLNIVQGAALAGAERIVAIDVVPEKLELARSFGATDVLDASEPGVAQRVHELCGGVDHAFEATGARGPLDEAVAMTRVGGASYFIGIPRDRAALEIDVLGTLIAGQRRLVGVYMGSTNPRRDLPRYSRWYLQGRLDLDRLVARRIRLDDINDAYAEQAGGAVARCVVTSF